MTFAQSVLLTDPFAENEFVSLFYLIFLVKLILSFHTLRVHYMHAAANLNSGYSKYAKVRACALFFFTIALRTSRAVLTRV